MEILLGIIGAFTFFSLNNKKKETFEDVVLDSESYQRPKILSKKELQNESISLNQFMNDLDNDKYINLALKI